MDPEKLPILRGSRLDLVPLAEMHAQKVVAWRNDPAIRDYMLTRSPLTIDDHAVWFARYRRDDTDASFVLRRHDGPLIGMIALYNIDHVQSVAELGRVFIGDPAFRRLGLAREASELILDLAFGRLSLQRIDLVVLPGNTAAIHLYESLGFVRTHEGQRDSRGGHTRQVLFMSLKAPKTGIRPPAD
jgi:RimJ/RimL family protein N-acetyltransferase